MINKYIRSSRRGLPPCWVVEDSFFEVFRDYIERSGVLGVRLSAFEGTEACNSIVFLLHPKNASHSVIAELALRTAVPFAVSTFDERRDPLNDLDEGLQEGQTADGGVIIDGETGMITIIGSDKKEERYRIGECQVDNILRAKRWGYCILKGHGESGHMKLGGYVVCPSFRDNVLVDNTEGAASCCAIPSQCRRSSEQLIPISLAEIKANKLVTLTCGGWTVGDELYPGDISSVRAIGRSQCVEGWITTIGPLKLRSQEFNLLCKTFIEAESLKDWTWLWNEVHRKRWGYPVLVLWERLGAQDADLHGWPSLFAPLLSEHKERVLNSHNGLPTFRGHSFFISNSASEFTPLKAVSSETLYSIFKVIETGKAIPDRFVRYASSQTWTDLEQNGQLREIISKAIEIGKKSWMLERGQARVIRGGILNANLRDQAVHLDNDIKELDGKLLDALCGLLSKEDFWDICSCDEYYESLSSGACPFNNEHRVNEAKYKIGSDSLIYRDCAVCGTISVGSDNLVSDLTVLVPRQGQIGDVISIRFEFGDQCLGAEFAVYIEENPTGVRKLFRRTYLVDTYLNIAYEIEGLIKEVHYVRYCLVKDGRFVWGQRRFLVR